MATRICNGLAPGARNRIKKCQICKNQVFTSEEEFKDHFNTSIHKYRNMFRNNRDKLADRISELEISDHSNISLDINEEKTVSISLKNVSSSPTVMQITQIHKLIECAYIEAKWVDRIPCNLTKGEVFTIDLIMSFRDYNAYLYPLVLDMKVISTRETAIKTLLLQPVIRVFKQELRELAPVNPYAPTKKPIIEATSVEIIKGHRPKYTTKGNLHSTLHLKTYAIPPMLTEALNHHFKEFYLNPEERAVVTTVRSLFCDSRGENVLPNEMGLTNRNYCKRFQYLLWFEEHQQNVDIRSFDQSDVPVHFDRQSKLIVLQIPGLSEGRPSVMKGDSIFVKLRGDTCRYEGFIHHVEMDTLHVGFNEVFIRKHLQGMKYEVEFKFSRRNLQLCHRAVEYADINNVTDYLFPKLSRAKLSNIKLKPMFNKLIESNAKQKLAVTNIVHNTSTPAPYIVFGPPGTGKTVTLVESIKQVWSVYDKPKICVCAPSNTACDLITTRLLQNIPGHEILRFYGLSRSGDIPKNLECCSNFDRITKEYYIPTDHQIRSKSIIVATLITAGRLVSAGFNNYFRYMFLDEVGQAIEPEAMVPIIGLLTRRNGNRGEFTGNLVIAGDPKQLGPVLRSLVAINIGLDISLLERLMKGSSFYQKDPVTNEYNSKFITKLTYNYRSHNALLYVPNTLFYENELQEKGNSLILNHFCNWNELPVKNFPLIFHGVKGIDERESNSPSYFNRSEIQVVLNYVQKLLTERISGRILKQEEIGVVTPYKKQVQKIRQMLTKKNWNEIEVASVEEFQGKEKFVIIISTVRSREEYLENDYKFGLGFLKNPKRFNVAITRAKSLLVVVGNPNILKYDRHWRTLINFCLEKGAFKGEKPAGEMPEEDEMLRLARDLSNLTIRAKEAPSEETIYVRKEY